MGKPKNEFTFLLIDTSESMNQMSIHVEDDDEKKKKKHFGGRSEPSSISKFEAAIQASKTIVLTKKRIVDTDKFGIVTYNDSGSSLVQELTANHELLIKALDTLKMGATITPEKRGKLAGAFSLCIQEFAKQLKFVGNLMLRIFVLTDDMHREGISAEERRLAEINRDIGVYIDVLYFGTDPGNQGVDEDADADGFFSESTGDEDTSLSFGLEADTGNEAPSGDDRQILEEQGLLIPGLQPEKKATKAMVQKKRKKLHNDVRIIADATDGLFLDGKQNTAEITKHARKLGDIKDLEEGLDAFESAPVRKKKLISAIAEELGPLDISEIQAVSEGKSDLKCNICFQKTNPYQLRRCSYCKREMHLQCVMKWAEQDQDKEESFVFRCPFCFHLLKVDPTVTKLMDLQTVRENVAKSQAGKAAKPTETSATVLNPSQIMSLPEPCEVCGILLEEDDKVYQCNNCGVAYHEKCFNHTLQANKQHCRRCGYHFAS